MGASSTQGPRLIRFGVFELDVRTGELRRSGVRVDLQDQPLKVLECLLERPGTLGTREELRMRLWPSDTFIDFEQGLNAAVRRLRDALADSAETPRFVETLPRRGYRFIAPVDNAGDRPHPDAPALRDRDIRADEPATEPAYRFIGPVEEPVGDFRPSADRADLAIVRADRDKNRTQRWIATAAVVLVMATALAATWSFARRLRSVAAPTPPRLKLAVLPFQNLSGVPDQEYLSDGLTEETISDLGRLSSENLGVIARTSAMRYKHTTKTVGEIGRELGVDYVVEGSVRRDRENVCVTARLIRVADQTQLWTRSDDRQLRDLLTLEGELGQAIAEQVQLKLTPAQKATLTRTSYTDPRAYEAYLKARYFWSQFRLDSLNRSIDYYKEALESDDQYAAAYAGLAAAYSVRANLYTRPTEDYPKAQAAANKALQLDESLPLTHQVMAAIHIFYDWDWRGANRELTRLWQLDPNPTSHGLEAYYLEAMGRSEEAAALLESIVLLDPLSPNLGDDLGWAYYYLHRPADTISQQRKTLEIDPNFPLAHISLGLAYEQDGDLDAAAAEYGKAHDLAHLDVAHLARIHAKRGDAAAAAALRRDLEEKAKREYVDPIALTILDIGIGDTEAAAGWLERAYENRSAMLIWLNVDPVFEPMRSDARFQKVRRAVGLPE